MKKTRMLLGTGMTAAILLLILGFYYYRAYEKEPVQTAAISVIVYGSDSERWDKLRSGAEQSAQEQSAEINLVTMAEETDAVEEKRLIQREIDNGADALLIASCDSNQLKQTARELSGKIPVRFLESGVWEGESACISADDYQMGRALGEELLKQENSQVKIAIIGEHIMRDSVERRYQGLRDVLRGRAGSITLWERRENEKDLKAMLFLQRELTEEAVDVVVALDNSTTEAMVEAVDNLDRDVKLYGIGNSDKAVSYLDNEMLSALCYQNEFSIGYLGVQSLMENRSYSKEEIHQKIEYRIVTKKTLYEPENQKMLFPFVK